ncbi:cop9 signalosome complex subunit 7/dendritic cell protein ga17 [Anaeramoeba ignava]|uniref:Cop9 signalosome complex subunit 7/dendritic cell protein ga17 n=1 Tax=Anaeramoeba ignava TaxID=1746090 RepID=A0A9Q0RDY8_ANAIG|nr:cop9 signalosome complex subunit 7/dendritic cell protein ga17 [Anaeramoeba ignava]
MEFQTNFEPFGVFFIIAEHFDTLTSKKHNFKTDLLALNDKLSKQKKKPVTVSQRYCNFCEKILEYDSTAKITINFDFPTLKSFYRFLFFGLNTINPKDLVSYIDQIITKIDNYHLSIQQKMQLFFHIFNSLSDHHGKSKARILSKIAILCGENKQMIEILFRNCGDFSQLQKWINSWNIQEKLLEKMLSNIISAFNHLNKRFDVTLFKVNLLASPYFVLQNKESFIESLLKELIENNFVILFDKTLTLPNLESIVKQTENNKIKQNYEILKLFCGRNLNEIINYFNKNQNSLSENITKINLENSTRTMILLQMKGEFSYEEAMKKLSFENQTEFEKFLIKTMVDEITEICLDQLNRKLFISLDKKISAFIPSDDSQDWDSIKAALNSWKNQLSSLNDLISTNAPIQDFDKSKKFNQKSKPKYHNQHYNQYHNQQHNQQYNPQYKQQYNKQHNQQYNKHHNQQNNQYHNQQNNQYHNQQHKYQKYPSNTRQYHQK